MTVWNSTLSKNWMCCTLKCYYLFQIDGGYILLWKGLPYCLNISHDSIILICFPRSCPNSIMLTCNVRWEVLEMYLPFIMPEPLVDTGHIYILQPPPTPQPPFVLLEFIHYWRYVEIFVEYFLLLALYTMVEIIIQWKIYSL